jgi:AraC-like DNA-binding protein
MASGDGPGSRGDRASPGVDRIDRSILYMEQHLDQPLQVAKLAAMANVSASHFFALFKRRTGCSPIGFFIRLRMRHACRLLRGTLMSVKEVAATLGYEDPFYFSRIFKSVVRVAPSEYRAVCQAEMADEATDSAPGRLLVQLPVRAGAPGEAFGPRREKAPLDAVEAERLEYAVADA